MAVKSKSGNEEKKRLEAARTENVPWRKWGPYLSERQWGTVREDYSADGDAWNYFTHDQARSRAYRWGEDGLAGISDDKQRLCFALALWNGKDPILKERLFGLTNSRGQPRRGREGVLLLPRQHAHPLLHEVPLQVPPGGVPLRGPRHDEPAARLATRWSMSSSTPACSMTTATSTSSWSTPKRCRGHSRFGSRRPTGGRRRHDLHLLPTLWFRNTWSRGLPSPTELPRNQASSRSRHRSEHGRGHASAAWDVLPLLARAMSRCSSPRTKRTTSGFSPGRPNAEPLRQGRHQRLRGITAKRTR